MDRRAWFFLACAILNPWQLYHIATHPQFFRPPLPIGDGPDYETIGYSLSVGKGFSFAWDDPTWRAPYLADAASDEYLHLKQNTKSGTTTARPPLIPIALSAIYGAIGRDSRAFAVFRCLSALAIGIAGSLAVFIAFELTQKMVHDRWTLHVAATATLTFAFFDTTLRTYAVDFLSEPLALLWTTVFLCCGLSLRNSSGPFKIFGLAVCMAAMIATRSMFVFWVPGILLILLYSFRTKAIAKTLAFLVVVCLLLSPWCIRNCQQLQSFKPMGAQGPISIMGGYSDEALADQGNWHPDADRRLRLILASAPGANEWSNVELERRLAVAASIETRHWIKLHLRDLPYLCALRLKTHWGPYFGKSLIWRLGMLLGVAVLLMHRRWEAYWLLGIPLVSSLTVMLSYETGGRFLVPLYALLYALAGIGIAATFSKVCEIRR